MDSEKFQTEQASIVKELATQNFSTIQRLQTEFEDIEERFQQFLLDAMSIWRDMESNSRQLKRLYDSMNDSMQNSFRVLQEQHQKISTHNERLVLHTVLLDRARKDV